MRTINRWAVGRWAVALLGLVALAFAGLACDSGGGGESAVVTPTSPLPDVTGGVYLALGDAIAAGGGASDAASTGYVALVAQALRSRFGEELELQSLAVGGHATQALIDQQLPRALGRLEAGAVRVVTVTIALNDLDVYLVDGACLPDPSVPACPLEDALLGVEQRLDRILGDLREAGPGATIVILAYPNFYSGTGHQLERPAEIAFDLLNGVISTVAKRHNVLVADPRTAFQDRGNELTHLLDAEPDFHPNDAGHRVIADAFLEVLGVSTDGGTD
jgi:lysophospholipase L1-like esterase